MALKMNRREFSEATVGTCLGGAVSPLQLAGLIAQADAALVGLLAQHSSVANVATLLRAVLKRIELHIKAKDQARPHVQESAAHIWKSEELHQVQENIDAFARDTFSMSRHVTDALMQSFSLMLKDPEMKAHIRTLEDIQERSTALQQKKPARMYEQIELTPEQEDFLLQEGALEDERLQCELAAFRCIGFYESGVHFELSQINYSLHAVGQYHISVYPWEYYGRRPLSESRFRMEAGVDAWLSVEQYAEKLFSNCVKVSGNETPLPHEVRRATQATCEQLCAIHFPEVPLVRMRFEVAKKTKIQNAFWDDVANDIRADIAREANALFAVPHVDDDALYMRLHRLCAEQRRQWEEEAFLQIMEPQSTS